MTVSAPMASHNMSPEELQELVHLVNGARVVAPANFPQFFQLREWPGAYDGKLYAYCIPCHAWNDENHQGSEKHVRACQWQAANWRDVDSISRIMHTVKPDTPPGPPPPLRVLGSTSSSSQSEPWYVPQALLALPSAAAHWEGPVVSNVQELPAAAASWASPVPATLPVAGASCAIPVQATLPPAATSWASPVPATLPSPVVSSVQKEPATPQSAAASWASPVASSFQAMGSQPAAGEPPSPPSPLPPVKAAPVGLAPPRQTGAASTVNAPPPLKAAPPMIVRPPLKAAPPLPTDATAGLITNADARRRIQELESKVLVLKESLQTTEEEIARMRKVVAEDEPVEA